MAKTFLHCEIEDAREDMEQAESAWACTNGKSKRHLKRLKRRFDEKANDLHELLERQKGNR